jgi:dTDP-4-dehydrorhamnose reductase
LRKNNTIRQAILKFAPDIVIHCAAETNVDVCESKPERAWEINAEGTRDVVLHSEAVGAKIVLLSTSFVFDGELDHYGPEDKPNPSNVYGETKLAAEEAVLQSYAPGLILRTDQPFGWSERWQTDTMVEWVLNQLGRNEPFPVFQDWWNCPTFIDDLVQMILSLGMNEHRGIYHCVGSGYVSRYQWAKLIADVFDLNKEHIIKGQSDSPKLPAARPNVHLRNSKMRAATGIETHSLRESTRKLQDVANKSYQPY